jgi:hypothetical protein
MKKLKLIRFVMFILLLFVTTACMAEPQTQKKPVDYATLCKIYQDVASKPMDLGLMEMEIAGQVQKQLPDYFKRTFVNIMKFDAKDRYQTMKQLIEQDTNASWDCAPMKAYYDTQFN